MHISLRDDVGLLVACHWRGGISVLSRILSPEIERGSSMLIGCQSMDLQNAGPLVFVQAFMTPTYLAPKSIILFLCEKERRWVSND